MVRACSVGSISLSSCRRISGMSIRRLPKARRSRATNKRLAQRTTHQAGGTHAVGQARVVDHVGHLLEAAAGLADQPGACAFEADLATGHRARAQLVFQPQDAVGVHRTVVQPSRQQEQRHAGHAGRRAVDARQHHRQVGIGVGTEPLVAVQPKAVAVRRGPRGGGGHIGAGALFGHEHRALMKIVEALRRQPRQVLGDQCRAAELAQRARQRIGHRQRAAKAELGLHEQVGQGVLGRRRQRVGPAEHAAAVRHRRQAVLAEGDALHRHIVGVLDDALQVQARAGTVFQFGRVPVGAGGERIQHPARQAAQALQMGAQVLQQRRLQVQRQQRAQAGVGVEQVAALCVGHRMDGFRSHAVLGLRRT